MLPKPVHIGVMAPPFPNVVVPSWQLQLNFVHFCVYMHSGTLLQIASMFKIHTVTLIKLAMGPLNSLICIIPCTIMITFKFFNKCKVHHLIVN